MPGRGRIQSAFLVPFPDNAERSVRILANVLPRKGYWGRIFFQNGSHGVGLGLPTKGTLAGHHLIENCAQTEDIAAVIYSLAPNLFGGHLAYGPQNGTRLGLGGPTQWSRLPNSPMK